MDGIFPLPLDALWELLHAHLDENVLREIHRWILRGRSIREGEPMEFHGLTFPQVKIAERLIRVGVRPAMSVWTYRIEPPVRYRYEIAFPNGSLTRVDNTYSSTEGGTLVRTVGTFSIKRVPSFIALRIVKRSFERSDSEDLAYARRFL